jgi:raffinose/stachyose/melibiose transport system substrate-binding protein
MLGACNGSDTPTGEGSGDQTQEAVELKLWLTTQEDSQKAAWDTLISDFENAAEGITVTIEERSVDPHKEALRQVAGTNAGPDIYWYWEGSGLAGALVDAGMSLDLTEYYDEYGWRDRFSAAALGGITQYGGYHGVPWTLQGQALFYNKTLFEQAGITELPADYNALVAAADALVAQGVVPIEFGGTVNWHVMRLLDNLIETTCGSDTRDQLFNKDADWGATACLDQAFADLKTWSDKYINEGFIAVSNDDSTQLFYQGQAAMALEGTWFDGMVPDNGLDPNDIGIFQFPTGTGRLYSFGEGFYINAASANQDAAAKFLDFITSADEMTKTAGVWAALSVNTDVPVSDANPLDAIWVTIFGQATGTFVNSDQALSLDETTEYWRVQNAVVIGEMAPGDAGKAMQTFFDNE